jgi:hypothetical protein
MLDAVDTTCSAIISEDIDAAAVALAKVYAKQLDQAAIIRRQADKALQEAESSGDETLIEQVSALRAKVSEQGCIDRIGARLHNLLIELQATPKARGGMKPAPSQTGTLHRLRAAK